MALATGLGVVPLPAALAPVLVGSGAAAAVDAFDPSIALLALVVSTSLQIAVNYANDYSDGVRGTDEERVGPVRLVGQLQPRARGAGGGKGLDFVKHCRIGSRRCPLSPERRSEDRRAKRKCGGLGREVR